MWLKDATEIIVSLNDRREFLAEVVGVDPAFRSCRFKN